MSPCHSLPEFFVDRSLGRYAVPNALRAAGWTIRTHHEVYAERDEAVEDVEWLEYAGSSDLVVLTRDNGFGTGVPRSPRSAASAFVRSP